MFITFLYGVHITNHYILLLILLDNPAPAHVDALWGFNTFNVHYFLLKEMIFTQAPFSPKKLILNNWQITSSNDCRKWTTCQNDSVPQVKCSWNFNQKNQKITKQHESHRWCMLKTWGTSIIQRCMKTTQDTTYKRKKKFATIEFQIWATSSDVRQSTAFQAFIFDAILSHFWYQKNIYIYRYRYDMETVYNINHDKHKQVSVIKCTWWRWSAMGAYLLLYIY